MSKPRLLYLETSTTVCSVALSEGDQLVALSEIEEANVHASQLTLRIEEVMQRLDWKYVDLDAVVVSKGPGSYTGLRIGVSTAKGLCYALGKPLIAVDSLHSLALGFLEKHQSLSEQAVLIPMIDARRMEVYASRWSKSMDNLLPTAAVIVDSETFSDLPTQATAYLFGSGADKLQALFKDHPQLKIVPAFAASAAYMISEAYEAYLAEKWEDLAYFEPYYLKEFVPTTPKNRV
jgi:tRNA threonylcarbamoyladenosine biosynthesis protein TsaB